MSTYLKIVFGFKQRYRICDVSHIFKQQRFYSILISQHNALDVDDCCDRPDVHFHGVVEFINGEGKIENFLMQLSPYCQYIKASHCSSPVEYLAYITLPPKRTIIQQILDSSVLLEYVQTARNMQVEIVRRKKNKRITLLARDIDVINLVDFVLKSGCNNNKNILTRLKKDELLWASLHEKHMPTIETALNISRKIVLNNSILALSNRLEMSDDYLSPEESARFVTDWCSFQNLDPKEFTKNLIRCLDKKSGNRNSIYLQGSRNSGKSYIVQSIIEACIHVGQVKDESSAYSFMWEKCVDKRLIVIHEPHFSIVNFDQLDKILSGSGTLVHKHNDVVDYLQPTPVIIVAHDQGWADSPELNDKIKKRFAGCYMNLNTYHVTNEKKLHPRWLNLLSKAFSGKQSSKAVKKNSKAAYERPLQSNPDPTNGMELITEERRRDGDKNAGSHSSKTNGDSVLFTKQISFNTNQDSENIMESSLNYRKRPMKDPEGDGGKKIRCVVGCDRGRIGKRSCFFS